MNRLFVLFLLISFVLFLLFSSWQNQKEELLTRSAFVPHPVHWRGTPWLFLALPKGNSYYKTQFQNGRWSRPEVAEGKLKGVTSLRGKLYLFFERHFCEYDEKGQLLRLVDYPHSWKFQSYFVSDKLRLIGEKEDGLYLWYPFEKEGLTPLALTGLSQVQAIRWKKGVFLFGFTEEGLEAHFWKPGEAEGLAFPTTLEKGLFTAFVTEGKLHLLGEAKLQDRRGLSLRHLTWNEEKGQFLPEPDVFLSEETQVPQGMSFYRDGRHSWLFVTFPYGVEVFEWQGGELKASGISPPSIWSAYIAPWALAVLGGFTLLFLLALLGRLGKLWQQRRRGRGQSSVGTVFMSPPAALWRRGFAYFLDVFLLSSGVLYFIPIEEARTLPGAVGFGIVFYALGLLYFSLCEYFLGKTLGKALFRLQVVALEQVSSKEASGGTPEGQIFRLRPLKWYEAVLRNGLRLLDDQGQWLVGLILIWLTPYRRLGDLVAGTLVVEDSWLSFWTVSEQDDPQDREDEVHP